MPNGGSDCCGTCWFNARNKGEAGYAHANDPEPNFCIIRGLAIGDAFYTYCSNHPHHSPNRDPIPIGPVFVEDGHERALSQPSPDTEEVRLHLLEIVRAIEENPVSGYPLGVPASEMAIWQLGEFREERAIDDLRRIAGYQPEALRDRLGHPWQPLAGAAQLALAKFGQS